MNHILNFKLLNERMAYLRLEAKSFNFSIINTEEDRNRLYDKFEEELE